MDEFDIRHALSRHIPDMQAHGFIIETCYGRWLIHADEAGDFIAVAQRLALKRLDDLRAQRASTDGEAAK